MPDRIVILGKDLHPVIAREFRRLGPELEDFVDAHDIAAECYGHNYGSWAFIFRHPKGGAASIQFSLVIDPQSGDVVGRIHPHWWVDDRPLNVRKAAILPSVSLASLELKEVRRALEAQLKAIVESDPIILSKESWIPSGGEDYPATFGPFNFPKFAS